MNDQEAYEAVVAFLSHQLGLDAHRITLGSKLSKDFGVDGDDAIDLLENYSAKFDVSLHDFAYDQYFGAESAIGPITLIKLALAFFLQPRCALNRT